MDEQQLRLAIRDAALEDKDAPYDHMGWGPKIFDCIGYIVWQGWKLDLMTRNIDQAYRVYTTDPDPRHMRKGLDLYMDKLPHKEDAGIGDVYWFRDRRRYNDYRWSPMHVGIITRKNKQATYVAHAFKVRMKVVETRIGGSHISGAWRYKGLSDVMQLIAP